jgi:hypothetical protein
MPLVRFDLIEGRDERDLEALPEMAKMSCARLWECFVLCESRGNAFAMAAT